MASDLLVFTCDYPTPPADCALLRRSCELQDISLVTYGEGGWPGYVQGKIVAARQFLETRDEPFAMFVDSRDVIILDRAERILDQYQRIGAPIVIAAEKTCWPDAALASHYPYPKAPFHNSPWRFINAGGWIGERKALINALVAAEDSGDRDDDQWRWTMAFLYSPKRLFIHIDAGCQIFQCMGGTAGYELAPDGENQVTHKRPKILHFNGRTPNIGLWYRNLTGDLGWKGQ